MALSIRDYVSEGTNVSYEQILQRFGDPKQVGFIYLNEMETEELQKVIHRRKEIICTVTAAASLMLLLWAVLISAAYMDHARNMNGYLAVGEVEIISNGTTDEGEN